MTKKELKVRTLHQQELLVKYQLVSDYVRQMSMIYEKSPGLFHEFAVPENLRQAFIDMNDLMALYLGK